MADIIKFGFSLAFGIILFFVFLKAFGSFLRAILALGVGLLLSLILFTYIPQKIDPYFKGEITSSEVVDNIKTDIKENTSEIIPTVKKYFYIIKERITNTSSDKMDDKKTE